MTKRWILLLGLALCLGSPGAGYADDTLGGAVRKLTRVGTGQNSEAIYLDVDEAVTMKASCTNPKRLVMPIGNPQYKDVLSIALVALAQARPIELVFVNNSCSPNGGIVVLRAVALVTGP